MKKRIWRNKDGNYKVDSLGLLFGYSSWEIYVDDFLCGKEKVVCYRYSLLVLEVLSFSGVVSTGEVINSIFFIGICFCNYQ